jgi:predicted O-methyltransferase YrrM
MMETANIFTILDRYIDNLFAPEDEVLTAARKEARKADLPEIQVSAGQGKFIYLLAKVVGARRILEIGTLGGYSTIWLARALPEDGLLVTLEIEKKYADVAASNLARAGLSKKLRL